MTVPNRSYSSPSYRYGFQGQEKDDEVKGNGNSLNYTFRMHDPRVGRFFAVDPLSPQYPHNSPYSFSENRVIDAVELEGQEMSKVVISFVNWMLLDELPKAIAIDKIENSECQNFSNEQQMRILGIWSFSVGTQVLEYTDINDAVVIGSWIDPGSKEAINITTRKASKLDKTFATAGVFIPVISGTGVARIWRFFSKSGGRKLAKGSFTVTEEALTYAGKSKNAMKDLTKLKATASQLSDRGLDVIVKGEGVANGAGEITILGAYGKEIAAESKRLSSDGANAVYKNIRKGTSQAGTGGTVIIDATQSGTTLESFQKGLNSFTNQVKKRKAAGSEGTSGTIIFLYGEKGMDVIKY